MTIKKVLIWPDPILTKVSVPVDKVDDSIKELVQSLIATALHNGEAAGLSAPQVGILKRVFIVNIPPEDNDGNGTNGFEAFINPEIIAREGSFEWQEGCLSIPGERGKVKRDYKVTMRYLDLEGKQQEREAFYYLGGCFQHEIDHLNGKLWIDYQSRLKKNLVKKRMLKLISRESVHHHECHDAGCSHVL